jgi:antitoxin component of RelBE/YafQ-DinJ toxin-antitoxin module
VPKKPKKAKTRHTTVVSVSLEPELHDDAKKMAKRYGMTVSLLIRVLLRRQSITGGDLAIPDNKPQD